MTLTYIDFQIDVGRFLAAQRSYLRRLALCPPALPPVAGVQIVLDRVDIGPSSLHHDEPTTFDVFYVERGEVVGEADAAKGFRTVLAQQLTLQLTTDADIRSHPNADPPLFAWPVTVLYELSAFAIDDDCCLEPHPTRSSSGRPHRFRLRSRPRSSRCSSPTSRHSYGSSLRPARPMGLDALDLPSGFLNAGVTVSDTGTTLAIRVEIRASQDLYWGAWQNFHNGSSSIGAKGATGRCTCPPPTSPIGSPPSCGRTCRRTTTSRPTREPRTSLCRGERAST